MKKFLLTRLAPITAAATSFFAPIVAKAVTVEDISQTLGLGSQSPRDVFINIINWALGLLSLIAVVLVLIGGFMWMTAAGNEEKIEKAKKILTAAIIGLIIILAAWGITNYAIRTFGTTTGSV